LRFQAR
jgi:hypothetical protein